MILCYYLNSSYARFNEHLLYSKEYNGKLIDTEVITEEIENEMLSNKEQYNIIESYFNVQLLSCGACGICNYESDNDTATIEYIKVSLESLPKAYEMTSSQMKRLDDWIKEGSVRILTVSSSFTNIIS